MPVWIGTIITVFQAIIKAAPDVAKAVENIRNFITGLFGAGVISKAQQDYLHSQVDSFVAAFTAGEVPPAWTVEPDPE